MEESDDETMDEDCFLTSPVIFSIFGGLLNRHEKVKKGRKMFSYRLNPIIRRYLKETIVDKSEKCCKNNPYKIQMEWNCEENYSAYQAEEVLFMKLLRNEMTDENTSIYPYLCKEKFASQKTKSCLLCNGIMAMATDYDCFHCRPDMLMFMEIMHNPSNWIPLGWSQYISHAIPDNPTILTGLRFNISSSKCDPSLVPYDIRNHLALSMTHCPNQHHVPYLEMLCI